MNATVLPMPGSTRVRMRSVWQWRPQLTVELLAMLASVYLALTANAALWQAAIPNGAQQWRLAISLFLLLFGLHGLLLGLLLARAWARPMLAVLLAVTAGASYYMQSYGVYLDADMLRNVLHTDWAESRELLTPGLVQHLLLHTGLPILVLWRLKLVRRSLPQGLLVRAGFLLLMWVVMMLGAAISFKDLSSLVRNQHQVRYLVTPANYLYGLGRLATSSSALKGAVLLPVGEDAHQVPAAAARKPRLLVLVVGETVRAQNWGLSGYPRQTTPELARLPVVNFRDTRACGSSTEVSLPCMFSALGRQDYDEGKIRSQQSLLHVLQRAGVDVLWRDNQSGCKGVCRDLPFESVATAKDPQLCDGLRCLDEILLRDLPTRRVNNSGDRLIVLHMLGNHGPSYFQRYPAAFKRFQPACENPDLGSCSRTEIVNAYDNAVLYTDHVLARAIDQLQSVQDYDTALLYLSDHGESLGENGLYLHGMPHLIAPEQQLQVPMMMWFSPAFTAQTGLDMACVGDRSRQPTSHDALFSTVLGLFDVQTSVHRPGRDLLLACRTAPAGQPAGSP